MLVRNKTASWRSWGKWVQILGLIGLFGYLINRTPIAATIQHLRHIPLQFALLSLVLVSASVIMNAFSWHVALRGIGLSVPFVEVCSLYFQSFFVRGFFSFLGGDLVRGYKLALKTGRKFEVGASVFVSRAAMLYSLLMLAGICTWLWAPRARWATGVQQVGAIATSLGLLLLVLYRPIVGWAATLPSRYPSSKWFSALGRACEMLRLSGHSFLGAALASLVAQLISLWSVWWIAAGFQMELAPWQILLVISVLRIVLILPFSPNGLGLREVGLVSLLTGLGKDASGAFALGLTISFLTVVSSLPGGLLLLRDSLSRAAPD